MKKIFKKLLLGTVLVSSVGAFSAACTQKTETKTLPENALEGDHLNLSESLLQLRQVPSDIFKDLYKTKFFDKLYLVPNDTQDSIDIRVDKGVSLNLNTSADGSGSANSIDDQNYGFVNLYVQEFLKTIRLGKITKGDEDKKLHQFYKEDEFYVLDDSNQWVVLDLKKDNQYLPTSLDNKGNLVIKYQIKPHNSDKKISYQKTIHTNDQKGPLRKEITDFLHVQLSAHKEYFVQQLKQIKDVLASLPIALSLFAKPDSSIVKLSNDLVAKAAQVIKLIEEFMSKVDSKTLTNEYLTQTYFEFKNIISTSINEVIETEVNEIKKIRQLPSEKQQELINLFETIYLNGGASLAVPNPDVSNYLKTIFELAKNENPLVTKNLTSNEFALNLSKWLGINVNLLEEEKVTFRDLLLLITSIFSGQLSM